MPGRTASSSSSNCKRASGAHSNKVGYPQVEFEDGAATDGAIVDYVYENGEFKERV